MGMGRTRYPKDWIPNLPQEDQPALAALYAKATAPPSAFVQPLPPQPPSSLLAPPLPSRMSASGGLPAAPLSALSSTGMLAYAGPTGPQPLSATPVLFLGPSKSAPDLRRAVYDVLIGPSVGDARTVVSNQPLPLKILAIVDLAGNVALLIPGVDLPDLAVKGATRAVEVVVLRGAGITGRTEHALAELTRGTDMIVAVRGRPVGAAFFDRGIGIGDKRVLQLPAKPATVGKADNFLFGIRVVKTGGGKTTYVSDLDLALAFRRSGQMTNKQVEAQIVNRFNKLYGTPIMQHGDAINGIILGIAKQPKDTAALNQTIYIFQNGRYVGRGPLGDTYLHYIMEIALGH